MVGVKYNLHFLFRNKGVAKTFRVQKGVSQLITLRAPKNFNIGKYKIFSLNYKTTKLFLHLTNRVTTKSLLHSPNYYYMILKKLIAITPTIYINSIRVTIKTKFKLMWLEVLCFL